MSDRVSAGATFGADLLRAQALEHVPEKLNDFSDKNMPQLVDFERFLLDRMIPSGRKTL